MHTITNSLDRRQEKITKLEVSTILAAMLVENTGVAMMDSGGYHGRAWQRARAAVGIAEDEKKPDYHKVREYFEMQPSVTVDEPFCYKVHAGTPCDGVHDSSDVNYTVSAFAYLREVLSLDALCRAYNARFVPCADWDGSEVAPAYGLSSAGAAWLLERFDIEEPFNTYNGESTLSHILQGSFLRPKDGTAERYVLLQIHGGADARGGYTDARLFTVSGDYINPCPDVSGAINGISVTSRYDGHTLRRQDDGGHDDHVVQDITCTPTVELEMDEIY